MIESQASEELLGTICASNTLELISGHLDILGPFSLPIKYHRVNPYFSNWGYYLSIKLPASNVANLSAILPDTLLLDKIFVLRSVIK